MNGKVGSLYAATLTSIVVSPRGRRPLCLPIRTAIVLVPTPPAAIITSTLRACMRAPLVEALPTAKVVCAYLRRYALDCRSTIGARYPDALSTFAFVVDRLPDRIAGKSAKWILGHGDMISLALNRCAALCAVYYHHALNYTTSGLFHKGALRNG